ncbi:MAG: ABC transporter permease [Acetobacteraceae bacterium]|nr:ABC transporter permease [Acetobacteraceae bacterium]
MSGVLRAARANPALAAALLLGLLLLAVCLLATVWTPHAPGRINMRLRFAPPSDVHWLGTDHFGRDLASMMMRGARNTVAIALSGVLAGAVPGVAVGIWAAARQGLAGRAVMRVVDFLIAFPAVLAAVVVAAVMGPGLGTAVVAIAVASVPVFARLARVAALEVLARDFVAASRAAGRGEGWILVSHVLPNIAGLVLVQAASQLAVAALIEAGLSFLGLGMQPPEPSLGRMLADSQTHLSRAPQLALYPGALLALIVLCFSMLGDGLRDALDPRGRA